MHNGMFKTLEEVVDYYNNPYLTVSQPINIDTLLLQPLHLTEENKKDLVSFLKTLTDPQVKNKLKD
jgi:cytochrome c peroxidase